MSEWHVSIVASFRDERNEEHPFVKRAQGLRMTASTRWVHGEHVERRAQTGSPRRVLYTSNSAALEEQDEYSG